MSFYDFFHSGRLVLPHDKDIPINILPWLKENSIDLYVVEEPSRYEMECNFTESITRMKDIVVHSGYRDRFLEDVSIEAIEECSRLTIRDGYVDFYDFEMPGYTWKGGERHTEGSKYDSKPDLYIMGPCTMRGAMCSDERTIASYLQKMDSRWNVHNISGVYNWIHIRMRSLGLKPGDILCIMTRDVELYKRSGIKVISLRSCYEKDSENRLALRWDIPMHVNGKMNQ